MNIIKKFTTLLLLAISSTAFATEDLYIKRIEDFDMSLRFLTNLEEDNKGNMWYATLNGLIKYNGEEYTIYKADVKDPNYSILSNQIYSLKMINEELWVGTDKGLAKIKNGKVLKNLPSTIHFPPTWNEAVILDIMQDNKGRYWIAGKDGILSFDNNTEKGNIVPFPSLENPNQTYLVNSIEEIDNEIIFATNYGLLIYNENKKELEYLLEEDKKLNKEKGGYYSYIRKKENEIYLGKSTGTLAKLEKINNKFKLIEIDKVTDNLITFIEEYNENKLFIGTYPTGLLIYDLKTKTSKLFGNDKLKNYTLPSSGITYGKYDSQKNLWIATSSGLGMLDSAKKGLKVLTNQHEKFDLNHYQSKTILVTDNEIYIGTKNWFSIYDKKKQEFKKIDRETMPDQNVSVYDIQKIGEEIWIAHAKGLSIYNPKTKKIRHFEYKNPKKDGIFSDGIYKIEKENNQQAWLQPLYNADLILFDSKENKEIDRLQQISERFKNNGKQISDFLKIKEVFWIATSDSVWSLNTKTKTFEKIELKESTADISIHDLIFINGNLWVLTNNYGMFKIEEKSTLNPKITQLNIFNNSEIDEMYEDKTAIYAVDYNGNLLEVNKITMDVTEYKNVFPKELGLYSASLITDEDNIYLGSEEGLLQVAKKDLKMLELRNEVDIYKIANGKNNLTDLKYEKNIKLANENNSLNFKFTTKEMQAKELLKFRYMLEGFDKEWIYLSKKEEKQAFYTNLESGNYSFKVQSSEDGENWGKEANFDFYVKQSFVTYIAGLFITLFFISFIGHIMVKRKQVKQLNEQVNTDNLTKMPNRKAFNDKFKLELDKKDNEFAIILVDLDYFKEVNDTLGHDAGDELIKNVSSIMNRVAPENALSARLGGDEFAMIIPTKDLDIRRFSKKLHRNLNQVHYLNGEEVKGSASIGVAEYPKDSKTLDDLLKDADVALYNTKMNGKNNISFFENSMLNEYNYKLKLSTALRTAIKNNEFNVVYQPKVLVDTGEIYGYEAILKWHNPELGKIESKEFIPEAEKNGTMLLIGEWFLKEVCQQASNWHKKDLLSGSIGIQLSAKQVVNPNMANQIKELLIQLDLPPEKIELEITESILIDDIEQTIRFVNEMKLFGCKISIDEFGNSSLGSLKDLNVDSIVFDKAFIKDIESKKTRAIIKNMFNLANDLNITVLVEGVNTEGQLRIVKEEGFEYVQGDSYYKELSVQEVEKLM